MLVSVLTSPHPRPGEAAILNALFDAGLEQLHLRKHKQEKRVFERILDGIDPAYLDRVVLHDFPVLLRQFPLKGLHFDQGMLREGWLTAARRWAQRWYFKADWTSVTFHSLEEMEAAPTGIDQLWLSPAFNPISSPERGVGFGGKRLIKALSRQKRPVHAFGGVDATTAVEAQNLGYGGVVLQGSIWRSKDPVRALREIQDALVERPVQTREVAMSHAKSA